MKDAYDAYREETPDNTNTTFEVWCTEQKSPQFKFWFLIYRMELTILILIRSFREGVGLWLGFPSPHRRIMFYFVTSLLL
ncbi:hypothetical protein AAFF_G00315910 [Aldrovandia affinis]|uniref:Uncharacterized protein n=1 Tax=Aldrovandia affinis TaxID=143900 RepID=A0AAD7WQF0_9TELE|nr:hypothetical protein AAFF_G00410860 [Aldrovandia affinis]KAJ8405611.1 hypothetical protein AAFF_G00315910 [Aldrovandia affinis]